MKKANYRTNIWNDPIHIRKVTYKTYQNVYEQKISKRLHKKFNSDYYH